MRLIFVRHGEPDYEHDCLTANGRKQAQATAQRLKGEGITAIYASPMGRAVETASYTAAEYGLDIQKLDFMHEINWGDKTDSEPEQTDGADDGKEAEKLPFGGHPWSLGYRLLSQNPEYVGSTEWDRHHYFRDNKCLEYYRMISVEFDKFLSSLGFEREQGLYMCRETDKDTVALFAHGGSGAIMFSHVLNLPFPFVLSSMPYGVCSVSVIEFALHPGELVVPRLELFNDMGHIESFRAEKLTFEK